MSTHPRFILEDSLWKMFPEEWLRQTAKETGLILAFQRCVILRYLETLFVYA